MSERTKTHEQQADEIIALLARQCELYRELKELSDKQRNMISGDRPELLLNILRDRQTLVTALAKLNEQMGPYRRNWDTAYNALPAPQREVAAGYLHEINGLLRVILKTDQEDGALLSARKQAVANELADVTGNQTAHAAYTRQGARRAGPNADIRG